MLCSYTRAMATWRASMAKAGDARCVCGHERNDHGDDAPFTHNTYCRGADCDCEGFLRFDNLTTDDDPEPPELSGRGWSLEIER